MCFKSKNLYNRANYIVRQEFAKSGKIISAFDLNKLLKDEDVYKALPSKTAQQINIQLGKNWKSYTRGIKDWSKNKSKYKGKPNLPNYKDKNGKNIVFFDYMQGSLKDGKYKFPLTDNYIETFIHKEQFRLCRIVPYGYCYKVEIIYRLEAAKQMNENGRLLAIDLGLDNLATLTSNIGIPPIIINGKTLKSINNYYNKKLSILHSYAPNKSSNRIGKLSVKRNNIIDTHMHRISKWIIGYCQTYNIAKIVIGNNDHWKQGFKRQQGFNYMPFEKLIKQLTYKGEDKGIIVEVIDERYTSKASFIDNDHLPTEFGEHKFSGKRVKRGLYRSKDGILINADVNGSYNILRKSNPEFTYDRVKGVSLHPTRINIA